MAAVIVLHADLVDFYPWPAVQLLPHHVSGASCRALDPWRLDQEQYNELLHGLDIALEYGRYSSRISCVAKGTLRPSITQKNATGYSFTGEVDYLRRPPEVSWRSQSFFTRLLVHSRIRNGCIATVLHPTLRFHQYSRSATTSFRAIGS